MRDVPLSAAILISLVANFLALILMFGIVGGKRFGSFFDIPMLVFFYVVLAGLFNDPLGRAPVLSSPLAFPKPH
jgi:hypothetical protein